MLAEAATRLRRRTDATRPNAALDRVVERYLDDPESGIEAAVLAGSGKNRRLRLFFRSGCVPRLPRRIEGFRIELLPAVPARSCGLRTGTPVRHDRSGMRGAVTGLVRDAEGSLRILLASHVVNHRNDGRVHDTISASFDTFRVCAHVSQMTPFTFNNKDAWHSHDSALAMPSTDIEVVPGIPFGRLAGSRYPVWGEGITMIGARSRRTTGTITGMGRVTVSFDDDDSLWAVFQGMLLASPDLASDGDSGSLVVARSGESWCAVGMLIARNELFTVITPIQHIYGALGVRLY